MLQSLPRVWRLTPRVACFRRANVARRVPAARAQASIAAPAQQDTATPTPKLPDGPQFHYFVKQQHQQPSERAVVKTVGSAPPRKVYIETYGCQMNVNDSEVLLSVLANNGFAETTQDTDADVIFLNTCAIREQAEQRIWSRLGTLKQLKNKNKSRYITLQFRRSVQSCFSSSPSVHSAQHKKGWWVYRPPIVGVLGCMAERLKVKLLDSDKLVDIVAGPDAYRDIPRLIDTIEVRLQSC